MRPSSIIAVVVVAALLIGAGAAAYFFVWRPGYSSRQNNAIGVNVAVTGSKVPNDIQAAITKTDPPTLLDTQPLGPVVELTPAGRLPAPVTLRFKFNHQVGASDTVFLATAERPDGPWTLVPGHVTGAGWYAEAQTDHLSWWTPLWFDIQQAASDFKKQFIDGVSGDMTTTADKPHCDNEDQARQDNYSITSSAKDTLYWCFGIENGQRVLKIVNRMRYPLAVGYPGFTLKHQAIPNLDLDQLARFVTDDHTITLFPFEEADFTVSLPDGGGQAAIKTAYAGYAQGLYQLEVGLTTALLFLGEVKAAVGSKDLFLAAAKKMNDLLKVKNCANVLFDPRPGSVIQGCFDHNEVLDVFGWKGLILAALMVFGPIIEFFHSEFDVVHDQITGGSEYEVDIQRTNPQTLFAPYVGRWTVHGGHLTVNADRSGSETWNAGSCTGAAPTLNDPGCTGYAQIALVVNSDGSLTGTYQGIRYMQNNGQAAPPGFQDTDPGSWRTGDTFQLRFERQHLLRVTWLGRLSSDNSNPNYWCDDYAENNSWYECGA